MDDLKRNAEGYYDPTPFEAMKKMMGDKTMQVFRGDIYFVAKGNYNSIGSEQDMGRPAVIVSNNKGNEFSTVVEVVYLTGMEKKPLPTHVDVMARIPSTALCEQINSVSKNRLLEYVRTCTDAEMEAIDRALMISLGLDNAEVKPEGNLDGAIKALNEMNDDLRMKLEGAERELADRATERTELLNRLHEVERAADNRKLYDAANVENVIRLEAERDTYKRLYEQAIERMLGR